MTTANLLSDCASRLVGVIPQIKIAVIVKSRCLILIFPLLYCLQKVNNHIPTAETFFLNGKAVLLDER